MREKKQLDRVFKILESYTNELPLQHFLRYYFRRHKEMGSNDRRITTQAIYNWFRIGNALPAIEKQTRLAVATFLIDNAESAFVNHLLQEFSVLKKEDLILALDSKINLVKKAYKDFNLRDVFPFDTLTSSELDFDSFVKNFLTQPYLWIRLVNGNKILEVLDRNNIAYIRKENAIGIIKSIDLQKLEDIKSEWYEVQDFSSQSTGKLFRPLGGEKWYDCCAASGGKSLLLLSMMPDLELTVSDNREKILENLIKRFRKNHIKKYTSILADLEYAVPTELQNDYFDGIIADVPCTGSGTWSRSPEQINFFDSAVIEKYTERQQKIIGNVSSKLKKGKPLIYITCSVFKKENEDMVQWICRQYNFTVEEKLLIQGSAFHADTMFVARLLKQ